MQRDLPIAIVGAGIAGLTAALSLARHGISVDIVEQAQSLKEVGAGLQLSPNATAVLDRLGLTDTLSSHWREPDAIRLADGSSLRLVAEVPAGAYARARWGHPYAAIHRADLQQTLAEAVAANPLCRMHLGHRLDGIDAGRIETITGRRPAVLIGADGARSSLRANLPGAGARRFSGHVAWRMTLPFAEAPDILDARAVTAFMANRAHAVAYPLRDAFNLVVIGPGSSELAAGMAGPVPTALLSPWHRELRAALTKAAPAIAWPLYEVADGAWDDGSQRLLIGDAAHAMTPFAAQGAAMAIEDGFELAGFLAEARSPADAFTAYRRHRAGRIDKVRARAAFNRFAYHAAGPFRLGRNLVLALRSRESLAADFDWLYGYQARG
ncbi:salicylate hydroxylase [Xaviernesmea oryzae]|uniref:Salicylate hydroxylase n=1 Tax=Xaviernesmea oryzae TaxID=464029 RepID=A0A1Q9AX76_9HYPH|nr:FAD-dependent monooxygenase [Xaviernesmea oryzae]OLP60038.1 salicylate hydroxylase [Xaviernesmea oryzae]SEK39121.1 salicylate hydroxylase [Xaviernesmea oryzae]